MLKKKCLIELNEFRNNSKKNNLREYLGDIE